MENDIDELNDSVDYTNRLITSVCVRLHDLNSSLDLLLITNVILLSLILWRVW